MQLLPGPWYKYGQCALAMKLIWFLSLLNSLSLGESDSVLIIALPQSDGDTEMLASWEKGGEILPGALAAVEKAKNYPLSFNLTPVEANSGRYNLPYSGNVLEVIANLTRQNRISDIIGIAGVFHPSILAVLNRFQLPACSISRQFQWSWNPKQLSNTFHDCIHINSH